MIIQPINYLLLLGRTCFDVTLQPPAELCVGNYTVGPDRPFEQMSILIVDFILDELRPLQETRCELVSGQRITFWAAGYLEKLFVRQVKALVVADTRNGWLMVHCFSWKPTVKANESQIIIRAKHFIEMRMPC